MAAPGPIRRLRVEAGRIQLEHGSPGGCIAYGIALHEGGSTGAAVRRAGRDLIASPNAWLFRPERRAVDASATLRLELPSGVAALLPWPEQSGRYTLDSTAFRFDSYAAFGRFERTFGDCQGTGLELALLDGKLAIDGAAAVRAVCSAVDVLSHSDGGFPTRRVSAVVVPAGDHEDPVPFGMVARGGGASLLLLVSASADERAIARDWVLPHEFSHLLLPFIEREQAWLSEGLASYYQEILRARAGVQTAQRAFSRLTQSMRDAQRATGEASIVAESARMHVTHSYRQVYWGGAAYWLLADVALRRTSQGHASLDRVLSTLRKEGALMQLWSARTLISKLDSLAGAPLFSELLAEAEQRPFPAFEPTLEALGVRLDDAQVEFDDAAPLAEIRRALVAPVARTAR